MAKSDIDFDIKGLRELERNLLDLANEYGPRNARTALNRPMKEAMTIVEEDIRKNTPVDEGNLLQSVGQKAGKPRKTTRRELIGKNVVAWRSAGWINQNWHKMIAVEWGARGKPGLFVLHNALRNNADAVLSKLVEGWDESMKKTIARLNRRKERGKLKIR